MPTHRAENGGRNTGLARAPVRVVVTSMWHSAKDNLSGDAADHTGARSSMPALTLALSSLLALVAIGLFDFLGLAVLLPWTTSTLVRCADARTWPNIAILLAGGVTLALVGTWLLCVAHH